MFESRISAEVTKNYQVGNISRKKLWSGLVIWKDMLKNAWNDIANWRKKSLNKCVRSQLHAFVGSDMPRNQQVRGGLEPKWTIRTSSFVVWKLRTNSQYTSKVFQHLHKKLWAAKELSNFTIEAYKTM